MNTHQYQIVWCMKRMEGLKCTLRIVLQFLDGCKLGRCGVVCQLLSSPGEVYIS